MLIYFSFRNIDSRLSLISCTLLFIFQINTLFSCLTLAQMSSTERCRLWSVCMCLEFCHISLALPVPWTEFITQHAEHLEEKSEKIKSCGYVINLQNSLALAGTCPYKAVCRRLYQIQQFAKYILLSPLLTNNVTL